MHIISNEGREHNYAIQLDLKTTNNEVEYEALLAGLTLAKSLGVEEIEARADFQVVVNQVRGEFNAKSEKLRKYLQVVEKRHAYFRYFQIQQVSRTKNQKVDRLAKVASRQEGYSLPEETTVKTTEVPAIGVEAF